MRQAVVSLIVVLFASAAAAQTPEEGSEICGVLCGRSAGGDGEKSIQLFLPLKQTSVQLDVTAGQLSARVTQVFENDTPYPLEAAYIFPLPSRASVTDMELRVDERIIKSVVQEREEAKKTYEKAKKAGKKTALLEQERPNIFTTSVANFMPGETISVSFSYMEPLSYDNGSYRVNFPMVVGQRYIPWSIKADAKGNAVVKSPVKDPERLNPPILHPNIDSGHRLSISTRITGIPIKSIESSTHAIVVDRIDGESTRVSLRDGETIPNSDFNLRIALAESEQPQISFVESAGDKEQYGLLTVFPPTRKSPVDEADTPREVIFLIDTSGSMSGASIGQAKAGLKQCLQMLKPQDRFNIVRFASEHSSFAPQLRPASAGKLAAARGYIDALTADGGTEMQPALEHCLDIPQSQESMRLIVFLTDGCVGNEDSLMRLLSKKLGNARLFTFAIGSAPNEFLTRRMAEIGRGQFRCIHSHEEIDSVMSDFFKTLAAPVFTDIEIEWIDRTGRRRELQSYPSRAPDIFHGRPLQLLFRSNAGFDGSVIIRGDLAGETTLLEKEVDTEGSKECGQIDKLYGRARIDSLMYERLRASGKQEREIIKAQIVDVALRHQLVSAFTSRVAVEERISRTPDGELKSVKVPTPLPKGWNPSKFSATATNDALLLFIGLSALALFGTLSIRRKA